MTDGTTDGTSQLSTADLAYADGGQESWLGLLGDAVYFFAVTDGSSGPQLWRSDGTGTGTHPVEGIQLPAGAEPELLGVVGERLFIQRSLPPDRFVGERWHAVGHGGDLRPQRR